MTTTTRRRKDDDDDNDNNDDDSEVRGKREGRAVTSVPARKRRARDLGLRSNDFLFTTGLFSGKPTPG